MMTAAKMKQHLATRRHTDAVLAIARAPLRALTDAQLRKVIGSYATNVITSLEEDRGFIEWIPALLHERDVGRWVLTDRGRAYIQELADARAALRSK